MLIFVIFKLCSDKKEAKDTAYTQKERRIAPNGQTSTKEEVTHNSDYTLPMDRTETAVPTTFDPNTADSLTLIQVGLVPYQVSNLLKYRQHGGTYHRPEDFKSLYGLTVGQWEHIAPMIRISKEFQYLADNEDVSRTYPQYERRQPAPYSQRTTGGDVTHHDSAAYIHQQGEAGNGSPFHSANRITKLRQGEHVDLNSNDTTTLQKIPGIGPYYAKRIVGYGEKLGGYVSLEQLNDKELDFIPQGIETYLTVSGGNIRKLHINTLSVRELNAHPYITYPQAKQIAERVRLYGPMKSWDDLLFLSEFTERDKARLEPYVSFE